MPNTNAQLLTSTELLDIYGLPALNDSERREYFTLNQDELKVLKSFKDIQEAIYFAACLTFFKIKRTFVNFKYREITEERRQIMERYFPNKSPPKFLLKNHNSIARIENKVLTLCSYNRLTAKSSASIKLKLQQLASSNPRQRQLCKALLDLLVKQRIAIPGYSTIQNIVSNVWNCENDRVINTYLRHTNKSQREVIFSLLNKTDQHHRIISIKKDMKDFSTNELWQEIEKHSALKPIFEIAKTVLPKLRLPTATIDYYATLINYYNGARLKQISKHAAQLYLLCYCYTRYQILNDNLLEALKKRTLEYKSKADDYAKEQSLKQLETIKDVRHRTSNMLITIKNYPDQKHIPKVKLHEHIPEDELMVAAKLLVDENFDQSLLFWKHIDSANASIKLNLRKIFLALDLVVTNNDALQAVITYVKNSFLNNSFYDNPLPHHAKAWIRKNYHEQLIKNNEVIHNRFEFLLYLQIVHHILTNKLTLQNSIKYKRIDDDLMPNNKWKKNKYAILKKLDYPKLQSPIQETLKSKQDELTKLYKTVNAAILGGKNEDIIITHKQNGKQQWRLRPLESTTDPNESLLASFRQCSIVDAMRFVNNKTKFMKNFDAILPKSKKGEKDRKNTRDTKSAKNELDIVSIMAVTLANAIRVGVRKMSKISDLNASALVTAESAYIRVETLIAATDAINNAAAKLPIYKQWYINSILHGSLDGLKLETSLRNILARHSSKFFGCGVGVSAYNEIVNCFSIAGRLIGTHDYEGNFTFEMVHHQNTSEIKPKRVSTDKHGMNVLNFGLFDFTDMVYAPRIPKPHREILWGFGKAKDYEGLMIKPTKFADEDLIISEWDNIQHMVASLLTGDIKPSVVVRKLAAKDYNSRTKKAFVQYNNLVKSHFLLSYLHDREFRHAIELALNRGEEYNNLYRAITVLKKGELRGQNEIEMEIWHQCTRLISSVMLYYNAYILNSLYMATKSEAEKKFLIALSPCAWAHINLLGYYQFCDLFNGELFDQNIKLWDWKNAASFVEKS